MTDTLQMYPMFEEGKANQDQLLLNTRDIRVRVNVFIIEVTRNQQHQLLCIEYCIIVHIRYLHHSHRNVIFNMFLITSTYRFKAFLGCTHT